MPAAVAACWTARLTRVGGIGRPRSVNSSSLVWRSWDLAELVVDALEHVGGEKDLADLGKDREERDGLLPRGLSGAADARILPPTAESSHASRASRAACSVGAL